MGGSSEGESGKTDILIFIHLHVHTTSLLPSENDSEINVSEPTDDQGFYKNKGKDHALQIMTQEVCKIGTV